MSTRTVHRIAFLASLLALVVSPVARAQVPEGEEQRTIYALGVAVAQNLKSFNLSQAETRILLTGLAAGLSGEKPGIDLDAYREKITALGQSRSSARAAGEREASSKFLAEAASQKGARKTTSGLIYQETLAGKGDFPTLADNVVMHYTGMRRDGSVFNSSVEGGEPIDFPLAGMFACWKEGLQLMKPGGKAVITCPADLAYGDTGLPPGSGDLIAPGAALRFDIELIRIEKGAAAQPPKSEPAD